MTTYLAIVRVETADKDGWASAVGVPTFLLDGSIQGITDVYHAARIARKVVDIHEVYRVHVSVEGPSGDHASVKFEPK